MNIRAQAGHSGMDHHSGMSGHSGMDHGDMDMGQCSMNMLFTWSTQNLCIIFPSWRITSTPSLILSLLAIALLTAGYEGVRDLARRYDTATAPWSKPSDAEVRNGRVPSPLPGASAANMRLGSAGRRGGRKTVRAALYAVQVFYSFFVMLLFMTYNGWVMGAVAVGAFVGFLVFGGGRGERSVACH